MENFLRELRNHADFVAILVLVLILGLGGTRGISTVESFRSHLMHPPALERLIPELPLEFNAEVPEPGGRDFSSLFRSY